MTYEELLAKIDSYSCCSGAHEVALCAVVKLHSPEGRPDQQCKHCKKIYPCPTIQVIEKELQ